MEGSLDVWTAKPTGLGPVKVGFGLVLGAVAVGCLLAGPGYLALLLGALLSVAAVELVRALAPKGATRTWPVVIAAVLAFQALAYRRGEAAFEWCPLVLAASFVAVVARILADRERGEVVRTLAASLWAVTYVGFLGSFVLVVRGMPHGFRLTLALGLMAVLNDTGAFVVGSLFGKRALAPSLSPSKTREGALGGLAVTLLVGVVAAVWMDPPFGWAMAMALAVAVSVAGMAGDLAETMIKRDLGREDFGRLLPGHGGALDRMGSLLFAAPTFFLLARLFLR